MSSAAFSPIMIVGAFVLPDTTNGIMDASATRRPSIPLTLQNTSFHLRIWTYKITETKSTKCPG